MSVDVVVSNSSRRTYTVPSALVASVGTERATLDDVFQAYSTGDDATKTWAEKIVSGLKRDDDRKVESVLASIGYDPDHYLYWGLTSSSDDDLIHTLGRSPIEDAHLERAEMLASGVDWTPLTFDAARPPTSHGVAMEPDLLAFTASAFLEGCNGVMLSYGEPVYFLAEQPLLAAGPPQVVAQDGAVYAVVDATDTTAVMDVIMLKPGPQAYRRDGGAWVLDNATLDALLSATPPPIVALQGSTLTSVLEQVDGNQANQVSPNADGSGDAGHLLETEPLKPKPLQKTPTSSKTASQSEKIPTGPKASATPSKDSYSTNQNKSQLKDGSTVTAALEARYHENELLEVHYRSLGVNMQLMPLAASISENKAELFREAAEHRAELTTREHQLRNIIIPALVADARSVHDATPNQKKASNLRKYWVRGVGAVKIKWGTPGDFTRCERQLTKYLGSRAKGYCAKRHKETVGYWPGDKRNTGPSKGNTGQKSFK